jgi:hypothetical protein
MTEKEVQARVPIAAAPVGGAPPPAAARAPSAAAAQSSAVATPSAPAAAATTPSAPAAAAPIPRTLPKTASWWPFLALASVLSLAIGLALTIRRRFAAKVVWT